MRFPVKSCTILAIMGLLVFSSCRKSEDDYTPPENEGSLAGHQHMNTMTQKA